MNTSAKSAKRGLLSTCALALALIASSAAYGAGFAIYETSARGFAMGNANVGRNNDASALYSNPAAITQLEGTQVVAGLAFIAPSVDVSTQGSLDGSVPAGTWKKTSMNSYTEMVPHVYATHRFTEDLAIGLGIYVPYGLKSDFPEDWPGRYNNYLTDIKTVNINPNIAYRLVSNQPWAKQISVAFGIQAIYLDVDLRRYVPTGGGPAPFILQGDTWELGYNFAAQWEINSKVAIGINYRSGFKAHVTGASEQIGNTKRGGAEGKISLPDSFAIGLNYSPVEPLNIGVQALWTGWSDYETLSITTPSFGKRDSVKNWKDVWRYSIGAEYQVSNPITLRAGFVYDKDPVDPAHAEYMVPSNDRMIFSVGLGWNISKAFDIDFAYGYLSIKSRSFAMDGSRVTEGVLPTKMHRGHANIFSISANCRF